MANLLKKIKKTNKAIAEKKAELASTQDPLNGYFLKIGNETERQNNIDEIQMELRNLYSQKFSLLESLEIEIHCEKVDISAIQRNLSLTLNHKL